ncbi:MAG: DUF1206 domain-containing protein [Actinomycetota bacterium]|nr:DUF1206 domain-containing protein [Actinomycetota bacterium]
MARVGLAARGIVYALVGVLILQIAIGQGGARADKQGAFQALAERPFGRVLLVAVASGLLAYAGWRLVQALLDPAGEGDDAAGTVKRLGLAGRAVVYLAAFATCLPLILGSRQGGASSQERDVTVRALELPFGAWIVASAGLAVLGAGVYILYRAVSRRFREKLDVGDMGPLEERWTVRLAVAGLVAKGLVFALVGAFLVRAGVRHDPDRGVGLDAALREVAGKGYGPWLLVAAALGLVAYGVFSLIEVRYRKVLHA